MSDEVEKRKHNISIREMPMDLWLEFRAYCLRSRLTVEEAVVQALNDYLEKKLKDEVNNA